MRTGLLIALCVVVLAVLAFAAKPNSFDVFAEQIEAQIPGLQPSLSLLGNEVAISDTIAIGYVKDTEFSTPPRTYLNMYLAQFERVEAPGVRFVFRTGIFGQESYWQAAIPACENAACAEAVQVVPITPIEAAEWETYARGDHASIEIATAVIDGVNHWARVGFTRNQLGEVYAYDIVLFRDSAGPIERFFAQASGGSSDDTISRTLSNGLFLIK